MINRVITDIERFNFLCDCQDENALNVMAEMLGNRAKLTEMIDDLIQEIGDAE